MLSLKKYKSERQLVKLMEKKCSFCRISEENNVDPEDGKLYALEVGYRDYNTRNQTPRNVVLVCRVCAKKLKGLILIKKNPDYKAFRGTGRV